MKKKREEMGNPGRERKRQRNCIFGTRQCSRQEPSVETDEREREMKGERERGSEAGK